MRHHIDVHSVLRQTVCDLYSNLVTRPTGAAVRQEIEHLLAERATPSLIVIDFSRVGLLDFSCADEVIGKLLDGMRHSSSSGEGTEATEAYFIVRGARNDHLEAIESAIARYELAVIVESGDGSMEVLGVLDDPLRQAWHAVRRKGRAVPADLADELEQPIDALERVLESLWERRLVMRDAAGYVSIESPS